MRIQRRRLLSASLLVVSVALTACNEDDVGEACGEGPTDFFASPIDGESPVSEIVRLQRDRACETFKCITHSGLNPYCTQTCTLDESTVGDSCENDADCDPLFGDPNENEYCVNNTCIGDDCPAGFVCREFQDVGTAAGEMYCVRQTCDTNVDCGDLGNVECRSLGCYDQCFSDTAGLNVDTDAGTVSCPQEAENFLTCDPIEELPCACPGGAENCSDADLQCQPQGLPLPWPTSTVAQRGVCFGVEQDLPAGGTN